MDEENLERRREWTFHFVLVPRVNGFSNFREEDDTKYRRSEKIRNSNNVGTYFLMVILLVLSYLFSFSPLLVLTLPSLASSYIFREMDRACVREYAFNALLFPLSLSLSLNEERWKSNFLSRHERNFTLTHSGEHSGIFVPFQRCIPATSLGNSCLPFFIPCRDATGTPRGNFSPFIHRVLMIRSANAIISARFFSFPFASHRNVTFAWTRSFLRFLEI